MADIKENQNLISSEGLKKLKDELEFLKTTRRKEVVDQIALARSYGDLSENAEYDDAKNEQAKLERDIAELEERIANAVVIEGKDVDTSYVNVGTIVKVTDLRTGKEKEFTIVGETEINYKENKISVSSPVGSALLGKKTKDVVKVHAPVGDYDMKIVKITRQR